MNLHLVNIVNRSMGPDVWAYLHSNVDDYENDRVLVLHCERAKAPVYVKEGNSQHFYVRTGPSTTELPVGYVTDYIKQRFG